MHEWCRKTFGSGSPQLVRELSDVITRRGAPKMIVSDNGTELTSYPMLPWSGDAGTSRQARSILALWIDDYNTERPHSSLAYATPAVFSGALNARSLVAAK